MSRNLLIATALLCLPAGQALAQTYAANGVDVVETAAVIHVIPENRTDISVQTSAGRRLAAPQVRLLNNRVVIDGDLGNRIRGCGGGLLGAGSAVRINGFGALQRADLPTITIRTPMRVDYTAGGAVYTDITAFSNGRVRATGCGGTTIGPVSGALDVTLQGSGDIQIADVSSLDAQLNGSGALRASDVGQANLELRGSGELNAGRIQGALRARLSGSGAMHIDSVERGNAELELTGSGNLNVGPVTGNLRVRLSNSGSLSVERVNAEDVALELSGSGDLQVNGGTANQLSARLNGSGNLCFNGRTAHAAAELNGSGNLRIAQADHVERMIDNGSGHISIGAGR